jgi:hypothetical protein
MCRNWPERETGLSHEEKNIGGWYWKIGGGGRGAHPEFFFSFGGWEGSDTYI